MITLLPGGTFAALRTPNYRRYFTGQAISMVGTWMQSVGQSWLVLELTHSGTALGLVAAAQFLPVLLLAPYGGLLADRADKRHLLMGTQTVLGLLALTLGLLVVTGAVQLWMVVVLAVLFGLVNAVDNPARQSFALEMVGRDRLRNAISLNSVLVNVARALGPAVAGVLIATVGTGSASWSTRRASPPCSLALARMDPEALRPSPPAAREPGQVREGLRYVARTPELLVPLVMLALIGTLAYEFSVVLPLLARAPSAAGRHLRHPRLRDGGRRHRRRARRRGPVRHAACGRCRRPPRASAGPSWPPPSPRACAVEVVAMALVGAASVTFLATGNTTLQLAATPATAGG